MTEAYFGPHIYLGWGFDFIYLLCSNILTQSCFMSQMSPLAPEQKSRLPDYCASSVFVKILMLRGYSFDETSFSRISFQKKVRTHHKKGYPLNTQLKKWSCSNHLPLILQAGDTSVGWALGYMLSLSNLLPAERVGLRKALTPGAWGTLIFLFVLLLAAVLVFILLRAREGRKRGGNESNI